MSYEDCRGIESEGARRLFEPLLESGVARVGRSVLRFGGKVCGRNKQLTGGDVIAVSDGASRYIECKCERSESTGNFFLETFSNRSTWRRGWLDQLQDTSLLWYGFLDKHRVYSIDFRELKMWAFVRPRKPGSEHLGRIYAYEDRLQRTYTQDNDTWGIPVPISVIQNEVGFDLYTFDGRWSRTHFPPKRIWERTPALDLFVHG